MWHSAWSRCRWCASIVLASIVLNLALHLQSWEIVCPWIHIKSHSQRFWASFIFSWLMLSELEFETAFSLIWIGEAWIVFTFSCFCRVCFSYHVDVLSGVGSSWRQSSSRSGTAPGSAISPHVSSGLAREVVRTPQKVENGHSIETHEVRQGVFPKCLLCYVMYIGSPC